MIEILGLILAVFIYGSGHVLTQLGDKLCKFIVKHTGGTDA